ncbi:MAG: hypothetical protein ACTHX0_13440 [Brachybacterium sp.]
MTGQLLPRGRRPLGAYLDGYAAAWVWAMVRDRVDDSIRGYTERGRPDIAASIRNGVADLRESEQQRLEAVDRPIPADLGTAEVLAGLDSTESEPLGPPSGFHSEVDVRAAAAALEVGERRVRQLLSAGDLTGRQDRTGRWSVDADDLDRLVADRRITA